MCAHLVEGLGTLSPQLGPLHPSMAADALGGTRGLLGAGWKEQPHLELAHLQTGSVFISMVTRPRRRTFPSTALAVPLTLASEHVPPLNLVCCPGLLTRSASSCLKAAPCEVCPFPSCHSDAPQYQ